jgi:hypothetical protein
MLDAGVAILDVAGRPPRQGDGDEGRALVVDDPELDPWAVALGAGGAVLGTAQWWPTFKESGQALLLGAMGRPRRFGSVPERPTDRPATFDDAGMVVLRSRPVDGPEIWCRGDAGPHGFLSIAAHAHADALSVELRHDGVELLVDPGTYCYHGEPAWRQWFRSTAAHNTLEVAGENQSESGGPFLWVSQARAQTVGHDVRGGCQTWTAQHDGYRRLAVPTLHRRAVSLDSTNRLFSVVDTLDTGGWVEIRLSWHLGPDVCADLDGAVATLSWTTAGRLRRAVLVLPGELRWSAHTGEENPVLGWYSPGFGRRLRSTSLVGTGTGSSTTRLVTTLQFE